MRVKIHLDIDARSERRAEINTPGTREAARASSAFNPSGSIRRLSQLESLGLARDSRFDTDQGDVRFPSSRDLFLHQHLSTTSFLLADRPIPVVHSSSFRAAVHSWVLKLRFHTHIDRHRTQSVPVRPPRKRRLSAHYGREALRSSASPSFSPTRARALVGFALAIAFGSTPKHLFSKPRHIRSSSGIAFTEPWSSSSSSSQPTHRLVVAVAVAVAVVVAVRHSRAPLVRGRSSSSHHRADPLTHEPFGS